MTANGMYVADGITTCDWLMFFAMVADGIATVGMYQCTQGRCYGLVAGVTARVLILALVLCC